MKHDRKGQQQLYIVEVLLDGKVALHLQRWHFKAEGQMAAFAAALKQEPEFVDGVMKHLREEFDELSEAPSDPDEIADCLMLLFALAFHRGIDPLAALRAKDARNRARKWERAENGDWRHAKEIPAASSSL